MNTDKLNQLVSLLLYCNLIFHVRHFNAPNHAVHVVLKDAYEEFDSFADEIAEQYLALNPSIKVAPNYFLSPGVLSSFELADVTLLEKVIDAINFIEVSLVEAPASVTNIIDAHSSNLNRVLYLLRLAYGVI